MAVMGIELTVVSLYLLPLFATLSVVVLSVEVLTTKSGWLTQEQKLLCPWPVL